MKERLNYDKLIIGQSFFMEVIMKKGIIIAIILCLLGMIFLSGSVWKPNPFIKPKSSKISLAFETLRI